METSSRYRVIDGTLYARSVNPYAHDIRVHHLGHGHTEATCQPRYGWYEVDNLSPSALSDMAMCEGNIYVKGAWEPAPEESEASKLERVMRDRKRSAGRARTKVRRICKARGLNTMLTLTYRENMEDRERMARDFDVFMKRLRRVLPGLQYVCVFERQKRGAWHAHIAVPRVLSHYLHKGTLIKSYDLLRSVWLGVVGRDNGNCDVSRNKAVKRSAAKLAAYMSKYIGKGFEAATGEGDSYRASGRALPPPEVIRITGGISSVAVGEMFEMLSAKLTADAEYHHCILESGGHFVTVWQK